MYEDKRLVRVRACVSIGQGDYGLPIPNTLLGLNEISTSRVDSAGEALREGSLTI